MKDKIFVDTNILIYAHDSTAREKYKKASEIIGDLWANKTGVISNQALQEFYVNVTGKILKPLSSASARAIIKNYMVWHVELNSPENIVYASEIEERYQLSFWDSLIIAAAAKANASKILTEDLNAGQIIEGILIENPFYGAHQR